MFLSHPFLFGDEAATVLAQIACRDDGRLPQGGALSPLISNLVCRSLDNDLLQFAQRHKIRYTRYADDITFSTSRTTFPTELIDADTNPPTAGADFVSIVQNHDFAINKTKVKLRSRIRRQEVTGLTVNEFPNVRRELVRKIDGELYAWERHGYHAAQDVYEMKYADGGGVQLSNVIRGRLAYLKMIRGEDDYIYRRMVRKFNRLGSPKIPIALSHRSNHHPCATFRIRGISW